MNGLSGARIVHFILIQKTVLYLVWIDMTIGSVLTGNARKVGEKGCMINTHAIFANMVTSALILAVLWIGCITKCWLANNMIVS